MKARLRRLTGNLVLVETELGQKCVVPESELCSLAERFGLDIEGVECRSPSKAGF
ncbi:hypothetical protein [Aeropyrum camini]|uniref:Uncharacterized protein n=1 Tax=Aeropyrum camini SY1 = JCM 12091 TaxID=1198449 RepID=U3TGL2_9CREN|nr:hypothetical protein [Aeropyrum camini]BAN90484.1 hypothetical protein ACAM_1015 [Aeropyrum camini SY1 = JCM 12091]